MTLEDRIAGNQGSGVAVGAEAEVNEIEHQRRAADGAESGGVLQGGHVQVRRVHRHGIDLRGRDGRMIQQAFAQVREIAVGMSRRGHALIDLYEVHMRPGHIFAGEHAQHQPRGVAAADGHDEAAAIGDGGPRLLGNQAGGFLSNRIGIGQHFNLHVRLSLCSTG